MAAYQVTVDVPNGSDRAVSASAAEPYSPSSALQQPLLYDSSSRPPMSAGQITGDTSAQPSSTPSMYHPISSSDIKWGSQVLDILEHPSVLAAGVAFMIIIALQDVSLKVGLITASAVMLLDLLATMVWRVQQKLRHWPYALTHCFFWPLITWTILIMFFQQNQYQLWMNVFMWGSVATLMSMTVLYQYPFSRDIMKEKSPQGLWDEPWWTDLANHLANAWIIIFAAMCALSLIPTLTNRVIGRQTDHVLNLVFNYLAPIFLAAIGLAVTRSMQDKARVRWLLAPGATATAGAGAAASGGVGGRGVTGVPVQDAYEPLSGGAAV